MELTPADRTSRSNESPSSSNAPPTPVTETERWSSLITGGALVLLGLQRRSLRGALLALAGGGLAYHGATGQKSLQTSLQEATGLDQSVRVERTVSILNKTPAELYQYWRNLENLPTFMTHLKSIRVLDATHSHWVAEAPLGQSVEWDAEIIRDEENHLIAWASLPDATVENSGFVRFQSAPTGRGTEVKVVMEYTPPGGTVGAALAKLFGKEGEQQIADELRQFKMLMEAGEIATTEGQPSGRKGE